MKRPSLKRSPRQPTPQDAGAGAGRGPRFARRRRKQEGAARQPGEGSGRLRRAGRLLAAPVRGIARLKGPARVVVWGVLAIVVVVIALQLRGGRDDEQAVRDALARFERASADKDYQTLCDDLLASSYVRQTASSGLPCEVALRTGLEDVRNPTLRVLSVEVGNDRAAARVRGSAAGQVPAEDVYTLIREDGRWKILPPRPDAATP